MVFLELQTRKTKINYYENIDGVQVYTEITSFNGNTKKQRFHVIL